MGLGMTHGCWSGSCRSFNVWRSEIARVAGYPPLSSMLGFGGSTSWAPFADDPLSKLLDHSDCDGSIAAADCGPLADRLTELLPLLGEDDSWFDSNRKKTQRLIDGLRRAAAAGEDVEFH